MADYTDALESAHVEADPTSPQGLPRATGTGAVDVGTAAFPMNVEASNAAYWLMALGNKNEKLKPVLEPWIAQLKQMALQAEGAAAPPPAPPATPLGNVNTSAPAGPPQPPGPALGAPSPLPTPPA